MQQKIMDCFTNPIKCKIALEIHTMGKATTKQLVEKYSDIPQATIYRYLKKMTEDKMLKIVEENQIRGTVEKTYSIAFNFDQIQEEFIKNNTEDAFTLLFMQYSFSFLKQFQDYFKKEGADIVRDKVGFTLAPIYASDDELTSALEEYSKAIISLSNNKSREDRKLRTLGHITSPPENK